MTSVKLMQLKERNRFLFKFKERFSNTYSICWWKITVSLLFCLRSRVFLEAHPGRLLQFYLVCPSHRLVIKWIRNLPAETIYNLHFGMPFEASNSLIFFALFIHFISKTYLETVHFRHVNIHQNYIYLPISPSKYI